MSRNLVLTINNQKEIINKFIKYDKNHKNEPDLQLGVEANTNLHDFFNTFLYEWGCDPIWLQDICNEIDISFFYVYEDWSTIVFITNDNSKTFSYNSRFDDKTDEIRHKLMFKEQCILNKDNFDLVIEEGE